MRITNLDYGGINSLTVKDYDKSSVVISEEIDGSRGQDNCAVVWKNIYTDLFSLNNNADDNDVCKLHETFSKPANCMLPLFTSDEMFAAIRKLECNKSKGPDGLKSENFKYCDQSLVYVLCNLFNSFVRHSFLPANFMEVNITPILKKKGLDCKLSSSYRPIALATTSSKLLEHIILEKLQLELRTGYWQYGYKKNHGTELAVFSLKQIVSHYNKYGSDVFVSFLDASKAFDNVLHAKLCNKLLDRGIHPQLVKCFYFWWKNQTFRVKWGNKFSDSFRIQKAVRQGGVMSPVLFNIYTDELGSSLVFKGMGCRLDGLMTNCIFYADDICLLSPSVYGLQNLMHIAYEYALMHNLTFNVSKTVCMSFCVDKGCTQPDPIVSVNEVPLSWVDSYKYLGYTICNSVVGFDDKEILIRIQDMRKRMHMLFNRFHRLNFSTKKYLFMTYMNSMYCIANWVPRTLVVIRKVKVAYNDCIRLLFKFKRGVSVTDFCVKNGILTFNEMRRKACFSMLLRVKSTTNCMINIIKSKMCRNSNRVLHEWFSVLYPANSNFLTIADFVDG